MGGDFTVFWYHPAGSRCFATLVFPCALRPKGLKRQDGCQDILDLVLVSFGNNHPTGWFICVLETTFFLVSFWKHAPFHYALPAFQAG